ncbi:YceI family protein [Methylobacterium sp. NEAU 140]|uniref:YceI family protein n=1 Tax=Methylobacterium sp. NEAU 140 TaxID=3064945 RepID=UPI002735BC06|nr:YceI family protein [Methylobacterium sp. NEAU 140]MDP4023080.1 YceI family protein [Methylobacterium sp. NEAU 140]
MRATALALAGLFALASALASPAAAEEAPAGTKPAATTPDAPAPAAPSKDPTQVRPGAYVLDPDHGKITWSVSHLGYSTYYGQFTGLSGTLDLDPKAPEKSRLAVTVPLSGVLTGSARLERHLATPDFFDTQKFPTATFTATGVEPTSPTTARITGDLTLRGTTRPVAIDATFNQAGLSPVDKRYTVGFDGRAVVKRSEFGVNAFLPALGDEVTLRIEGEFKKAE